jgi:SAM-dependent methyltransferase
MECRICGGVASSPITIREKQYGTLEPFEYLVCSECGALQIAQVPRNLGQYYPKDYYSFRDLSPIGRKRRLLLRMAGVAQRFGRDDLTRRSGLSWIVDLLPPPPGKVLDIGSGSGELLRDLRLFGYQSFGVDPYIPRETKSDGVTLWKRELSEVRGTFDVIMSHHSLEHVVDPHATFEAVSRLLASDGVFILRVPIYPNTLWDEYGTDWPQLDAPRHLYTFTLASLELLASRTGLVVRDVTWDMPAWPFVAARSYREGRALVDLSAEELQGTPEDIEAAERANAEERGDQVRVVLAHA